MCVAAETELFGGFVGIEEGDAIDTVFFRIFSYLIRCDIRDRAF